MKKTLIVALCLLGAWATSAQTGQLRGKVVDATNKEPLSGANIEFGRNQGTTTDEKGEFVIACSDSLDLTVSYIGYASLKQKVSCRSAGLILYLQPIAKNLEEIQVTATSSSNRSQLEQPLSIVVMKEPELKRGTGLFLDDAINTNVPGVLMVRRTHSGGQQLNIRGYGNGIGIRGINGNFDSQGIKMYLNGIPITDAEGITVMDDIDFSSVSNVEVSKGPSGTLYGLAIAGVVNLQTQQAEQNKTSIGQEVMAGSYGLLRTTTRLAIGGERSSVLVNYGHQNFDGFMAHTNSRKDFVNVMSDFRLNDQQSLSVYLGYSDSYDERNGELTKEQYASLDYSGNPAYIKNNAHSAVRTFRAGFNHTYQFSKHFSNSTAFFGSSQNLDNSSAGGWTDKLPLNYGLRSTFNHQFQLSDQVTLSGITGIELQKMNAQTIGYGMSADSTNLSGYNIITSTRSNQATTNSTYSYFTQWTLGLPRGFSINAGIGVSSQFIQLTDRLWAPANNRPGNTRLKVYETSYKNLVSPTVAVNKTISRVASVYAAYSVGYKAPVSSNILISTTGQLNTGLKPEKGAQIEIGTKGSLLDNRLFYTLAVFQAKFSDKFTTVAVPNPANTATLYSYIINGGKLNNQGLEVLARFNLVESTNGFLRTLRPFANLTYSDFTYEDFLYQRINKDQVIIDDYSGNAVAGVAPWVVNLGVDADTEIGLYGNVNFNYRSAMYYTSDELNETDPFSLLNAKVGFRRTIGHVALDLFAGANNITGAQYYYMVFINQLPDAYIPGPNEINFFGGVNVNYIF